MEAMHIMHSVAGLRWLRRWSSITDLKLMVDNMYIWFTKNRQKLNGRKWCKTRKCIVKLTENEEQSLNVEIGTKCPLSPKQSMPKYQFEVMQKNGNIPNIIENTSNSNGNMLKSAPCDKDLHGTFPVFFHAIHYIQQRKKAEKLKTCKRTASNSLLQNTEVPVDSSTYNFNFPVRLLCHQHLLSKSTLLLKDELQNSGPVLVGGPCPSQETDDERSLGKDTIVNNSVPKFKFSDFPFRDQPVSYKYVLSEKCQDIFDRIQINYDMAEFIENETCKQQFNPHWHNFRKYILTSSKFFEIYYKRIYYQHLCFKLHHGFNKKIKKYGNLAEPVAAALYEEYTGNHIYSCGLVINPKAPHLGTSPDRKVYDTRTGSFGLLEIKCPKVDSLKDITTFLDTKNGLNLKTNCRSYFQVMGQLGITGLQWCDFMVLDKRGHFYIQRIHFNTTFWEKIKHRLDQFYFEIYLPYIIQRLNRK